MVGAHTCAYTCTRRHTTEKKSTEPQQSDSWKGHLSCHVLRDPAIGPGAGIPENLFEQPYYAVYVLHILKILLPSTVLAQPKSVLCTMCIPDAH